MMLTASKISANAVGANEIAANAITASKIQAGSITGDRITANTIYGGLLQTSGIITQSGQINDAVITNAKIGNAAVDTLKIQGNSVTITNILSYNPVSVNNIQYPVSGTYNFVGSNYFPVTGRIIVVANVGFYGTATSGDTATLRLYMGSSGSSGGTDVSNISFTGVSIMGIHTLVAEAAVNNTGWYQYRLEVSNLSYITNPSVDCDFVSFMRFR